MQNFKKFLKSLKKFLLFPAILAVIFFLFQLGTRSGAFHFTDASGLCGLFCLFILVMFVLSRKQNRALEQKNRELDYIRKGVDSIFSQYILVDLEADTYHYLSETRPSRVDFPASGKYTDLPAYICSFLINRNDYDTVMSQLAPEKIISHLGDSNTVLQYEYPIIRDSGPEWIHSSIICLERRDGKTSKVLFLWQNISYLKEKERRVQEKIAQATRREQRYITATLADAFCTYEINLMHAVIERVSVSSQNDLVRSQPGAEWVSKLEAVTVENPCLYHEWRDIWKDFVSDDSRGKYLEWADISRFQSLFEHGETESVIEYWTKSFSDRVYCIRESCYMMQDEETGDMMGLVVAKDITSQVNQQREQIQALQEALKQAKRANNAKNIFLSNMSHDIRTPMNAIIGFTNIALEHIDNREQVKHCLEKVRSSSGHLLGLLNDILDMTHIESGQMKLTEAPCSLSSLLYDMLNIIQPQARMKKLELSVNTYRVVNEYLIADSLKLCQIFINLLGNSVKYTHSGGKVIFEISEHPSFDEGYGCYDFVVRDNGIGMSPDFLNHLFEPFERESTVTKTGVRGTGLGLAITRHIVDLMGGTINVQSQKDKGTEFRIGLKIKLQEEQPVPGKYPKPEHMPVMVVSDDLDSQNSICELLQQLGVHPEYASSAADAVLRAKAPIHEADCRPLYILNWQSQDMDCIKTAKEIREMDNREISILVVTAYDWTIIEKEALAAGVTAFCAKPLFISNMGAALAHIIGQLTEDRENTRPALPDFKGKRVLLVEDNELNREIAEVILTEAGFRVDTAGDGTDAVEIMQNAEEFYYDAILSDIQMPIMDGFEAASTIRAMSRKDVRDIPIIAMTANTSDEDWAAAIESGMNYLIAKPLDVELFISVLGKFLMKGK